MNVETHKVYRIKGWPGHEGLVVWFFRGGLNIRDWLIKAFRYLYIICMSDVIYSLQEGHPGDEIQIRIVGERVLHNTANKIPRMLPGAQLSKSRSKL